MKKFNQESICEKCGSYAVQLKYCNGFPENDSFFGGVPDDFKPQEFTNKKCLSCGYSWNEEALNKK